MITNFTTHEKCRQSLGGFPKLAFYLLVSIAMFLGAESQATAALPGVHTGTTASGLFLGGNYIELGIRTGTDIGKFGTDDKPDNFFGRQGIYTGVGMVGDADGFGVGNDLRIDYFLPGVKEESFWAGYKIAGTPTTAKNFASTVTGTSSGNTLSATVVATLAGKLEVRQEISFDVDDKAFKNTVTLKNIGSVALDSVRFMRTVDPDNTVDMSGYYQTIQTVEKTISAGDPLSAVSAISQPDDNYYTIAGSQAKVLYVTTSPLGRVSFNSIDNLAPSGIYDPDVYDSAQTKGSTATVDGYISVALDAGTLNPGQSVKFVYYTVLDNRDITTIIEDIPNAAPTASNVKITGTISVGQTLTGNYTYSDAENNTEDKSAGGTKFQWYTGTDANCTGKTAISGANTQTYILTDAEKDKFVCFGVTPVATAGTLTGTEVVAAISTTLIMPIYASSPVPGVIPVINTAVPTDAMTTLTVSNTGTATLNITGITLSGADAGKFSVTPNTFPVSIAVAGNNPFTITCSGSEKGTFNATMSVAHNAADTPANYTLTCNVTAAPVYTSSPNGTLTMTSCIPADARTTLAVTNTGSDDLQITGITLGGTSAAKFSVSPTATDSKPLTVGAGKSQVFTIIGNGKTVGTFIGTLEITHNAAGSPAKYTLSSVITSCYVPTYAPPVNQAPIADKLSVCTDGSNPVAVQLSGIDPDIPYTNWFIELMYPKTYSVVTPPQHGTLTGTPPVLFYTPDPGFTGTDSFTYRMSDGTLYSEPATATITITPGGCLCVSDTLDINVSCAEYQGVRYGFTLNYLKIADDPTGLYWKLNPLTLRNAAQSAENCISIGNDMKLDIPCARFQGTEFGFTMNYERPVGGDPSGLYWKMDRNTLKSH